MKRRLCRIDRASQIPNGIITIGAGFPQTISVSFKAIERVVGVRCGVEIGSAIGGDRGIECIKC